MRDVKPIAPPPDAKAKARAKDAGGLLAGTKPRRIVVVDGVFLPELSDLSGLEKGLTIGSLAEALAKSDAATLKHVGKVIETKDVAVAINTAFMGDGVVIHVADRVQILSLIHI